MAKQEECSVVVWKGVEWKRTSSAGPSHDWPSVFAHSQMAGGASEFLNIRLLSVCRPLQSGVADTGFLSQHSRGSSTRGPHRAELVASCGGNVAVFQYMYTKYTEYCTDVTLEGE